MIGAGLLKSRLHILKCPVCGSGALDFSAEIGAQEGIKCPKCKNLFLIEEGCISLLDRRNFSETKRHIQKFWGDTCKEWYSRLDESLNSEKLDVYLDEMVRMFKYVRHLAVTEMEPEKIAGSDILEIGSGGGAHAALFKRCGANITSIDITEERVKSTANKLRLVEEGTGLAVLADAENLPFRDNSFDIVYSNGVLHHSENTRKCIDEIYRVLKPNGKAIIMLYCRDSLKYRLDLLPRAIVRGLIFRFPEPKYLGLITEGRPKTGARNPITKVYSRRQVLDLFQNFEIISLRKNGFLFTDFFGGGRLRSLLIKLFRQKPFKGGVIVYGQPFYAGTRLEILLSRYFGFGWNIVGSKVLY